MMHEEEVLAKDALLSHLAELRMRLVWCIVAWLVAMIGCYMQVDVIMHWLTRPLAAAFDNPADKRLIFTSLPEAFITYIKLAMFAGFVVAFPVIAFQLYRFIAPGLYKHEKNAALPFIVAAPLLFYAGASLAYFYIFPAAWQFFVSFELPTGNPASLPVELETKLSEYLSLITSIILAFGITFQLPLGLLLLIRAGLLEVQTLKKSRRYTIVILLTVAAILTPPDVISQIGLFIALYGLYEIAILAGSFMERKVKK